MEQDNQKAGAFVEQFFYGTVTVGERGQVVIPAKARRDYGIENGDQMLIMGHPSKHGLMITKVDAIRAFLSQMIEDLKFVESQQPPEVNLIGQTNGDVAAEATNLHPAPLANKEGK